MDKALVTILLIIAGVTCVAFIFNSVFPAITRGSDAVVSMATKVDDRIKSQVDIIHAISEYDEDAAGNWTDTNSNSNYDIFAWVKNVGTSRILNVKGCDVFFGDKSSYTRIPHEDYASGVKPYWQDSIEDGSSEWELSKTLKITINYADNFTASGMAKNETYHIKIIIPNGIVDETYFSL